jgi:hypothetical protein
MRPLPFLATVSLAFLLGCSHRVPTGTVELIDTSLSITPRAEQATIDAVRAELGRMERGDILILIPITGDELNDAGGRILRLQAPTTRESYDADLQRFRKDAETQFVAWAAAFGAERNRTDILGSLDLARQEIDSLPKASHRRLVIESDFLEDDGQYRFVSDSYLANPERARVLAARLRGRHNFAIREMPLCLGRLESSDFPSLSPRRKDAVDAFWAAYFAPLRHGTAIQIDPAGMVAGSNTGCFFDQP